MTDVIRERFALWNKDEKRYRFFQLDMPQSGRWQGYEFLMEQAGDNHLKVRDRVTREQVIACFRRDREQAFANYGKQLQQCGMCGRTLTDPKSKERGIGPDCLKRI